jgi:hypothetical protein
MLRGPQRRPFLTLFAHLKRSHDEASAGAKEGLYRQQETIGLPTGLRRWQPPAASGSHAPGRCCAQIKLCVAVRYHGSITFSFSKGVATASSQVLMSSRAVIVAPVGLPQSRPESSFHWTMKLPSFDWRVATSEHGVAVARTPNSPCSGTRAWGAWQLTRTERVSNIELHGGTTDTLKHLSRLGGEAGPPDGTVVVSPPPCEPEGCAPLEWAGQTASTPLGRAG